jgi:hypothetical protein
LQRAKVSLFFQKNKLSAKLFIKKGFFARILHFFTIFAKRKAAYHPQQNRPEDGNGKSIHEENIDEIFNNDR